MRTSPETMTSDTIAPAVPQVIITPPPPPPPPSPLLLSPPPLQQFLPALSRPLENTQLRHQRVCQEEYADGSDDSKTTFTMKRKRVRFKLDSDHVVHDSATSTYRENRRNAQCGLTKRPHCQFGTNRDSDITLSSRMSDVTSQSNDETASTIIRDDSNRRGALERVKRILGRFSKAVAPGKSVAEKPRCSRIILVDQQNTHSDPPVKDNSLSGESRTRICFENMTRTGDSVPHVTLSALREGDGQISDVRLQPARTASETEGNSCRTSHSRYGSSSFCTFNIRPHSSDATGRSDQYRKSLINVQLYKMASRHHQHVHDKLPNQTKYVPLVQNDLPSHSENTGNDEPSEGTVPLKTSRYGEFSLSAAALPERPTQHKNVSNSACSKWSRYGVFTFGSQSPSDDQRPKETKSSARSIHSAPCSTKQSHFSKDGFTPHRAKNPDQQSLPCTQSSASALSSVQISGRSIKSLGEDSAQVAARMMVSKNAGCRGQQEEAVTTSSFAKIDVATLNKLGWSSTCLMTSHSLRGQRSQTAPPRNAMSVTLRPNSSADTEGRDTSYRLTKVEFRRLTEQVREVDNIIKNKFRRSPCEKLYRLTAVTSPDPATQALRDELQASRLPFHARQWRPLTPEDLPEPTVVRCRPISSRPTTAHGSRSTLTANVPPERPRSTPVHGLRTPHSSQHTLRLSPHPPSAPRPGTPRVEPGNYDTLSPRILSQLLDDIRPRPASASYGDRILTRPQKRRMLKERKNPKVNLNDDLSTTSGIDSDYCDGDDDDVSDEDNNVDDDDNDSSDSENGGFEPSLDDIRRQMPHPQSLFRLRPEKLDAIYVPEDKRDMRRFDFDAENVELPPYNFKCPLPDSLAKVSLRLCAREGSDWRDFLTSAPPDNAALKGMMDRLVELERYQIVTEDWEAKKLRNQIRRQEKQMALNGNSSGRATSARPRDKRCCGLCLQAACVGDCPEKRVIPGRCDKCHQPLCTGACQDSRYEQRMRHARSSDNLNLDEKPLPPPPRSPSRGCHSCLRRHNAKLINANNLILGRPKSSNATYSRGKASSRPARDLRPASAANMHSMLIKDFERMGIEPQQPSPPGKAPSSRPRSRNGLLPGKSSRSNRKNSITDSSSRKRKSRNSRSAKVPQTVS